MARRPRLDRELERYLVEGETPIVAVRRHWFSMFREILIACGATLLALWVDINVPRSPGGEVLHNLSLIVFWGALGWLVWRVLNWRREWFVATDKRFLLFYGFIRRKVAMMPLLKVTDMTFDRSLLGRVVGYGTFVLESAGQGQALSVINHVPDADTHYRSICTQLFGPGSQRRFAPDAPPPPPPPADDSGPGGPGDDDDDDGRGGGGAGAAGPAPVGGAPRRREAERAPLPSPISRPPESWYRSSNLREPSHLGDTGEIPVVRVLRDDEESPLYPPHHWAD
ncbi:MAG TPA: PH domain-containing protein [Ornithinibacter sp.]|nr:PH domain-containing protein [Ornithinibacter sp.]